MLKNTSEQELREAARIKSSVIVVRTYIGGNSEDTPRNTTKPEAEIIRNIFYGGFLAIRDGADVQSVADACEYILKQFIPEANGYDTIYRPLKEYCGAF